MPQGGGHSLLFLRADFPGLQSTQGAGKKKPGKNGENGVLLFQRLVELGEEAEPPVPAAAEAPPGLGAVTRRGQAGTRARGERGQRSRVTSNASPWGCQHPRQQRQSREKKCPNPACPQASSPLEATSCPPARYSDLATPLDAPLVSYELINYPAASSPKQIWVSRR